MKNKSFLFLFVFLVQALLVYAQSDPDWENLNYVEPGKKIAVHLKSGGEISGKFKRAGSGQLPIIRKNEEIKFNKENIKLIVCGEELSGKRKIMGALIGFGIGSAFGAYMSTAYDEGYGTFGDHLGASAASGLVGATIGMAVAGNRPPTGGCLLYSAPIDAHISIPLP
ncbi:hypothetical protein L0222_18225 [bacterium]|nr:hypothetical protein [bacterium]